MLLNAKDEHTQNRKIVPVWWLTEALKPIKNKGQKVVHCHGVFDLLHIGHIRYLKQARSFGDVLVVTITPDRFVDKGAHRPAFNESLRAEAIASLDVVDYVAINEWPTAEETLRTIRPDIYVKGSEYKDISSDMTGKIGREAEVVREIGCELRFTEDIVFSSTNLINRYLSNLPSEIQEYVRVLRQRHSLEEILGVIDKMKSLKVMVIGDTILDEYQYCDAIGKSSKDPILALKYQSHDLFAGGVIAVANHLAGFAGEVHLVSTIGEKDSHEDFIRTSLKPNITPHFMVQDDAPTLVKRRFLDGYSFNKLFEVYIMDDSGLNDKKDREFCEYAAAQAANYDLVIASDFGHGTISDRMVRTLIKSSDYLAVNAQANAGNRGFHMITRYPRLNYGCIAEHELLLAARNYRGGFKSKLNRLANKVHAERFVVTRGRKGCAVWNNSGGGLETPSLAENVVDRVGAGDAFFAVTSLAARQQAPDEIIGFLGNLVGGLAVEIQGNQKSVDPLAVKKYLVSLLK